MGLQTTLAGILAKMYGIFEPYTFPMPDKVFQGEGRKENGTGQRECNTLSTDFQLNSNIDFFPPPSAEMVAGELNWVNL